MPDDEDGLRQLSVSIRHQGHVAETPPAHKSFVRGGSGRSSPEGSFLETGTPQGVAGAEEYCPEEWNEEWSDEWDQDYDHD